MTPSGMNKAFTTLASKDGSGTPFCPWNYVMPSDGGSKSTKHTFI